MAGSNIISQLRFRLATTPLSRLRDSALTWRALSEPHQPHVRLKDHRWRN